MQPLYTEEEFKNATSRQTLPLKCLYCSNIFRRTKRDIHSYINPSQVGTGDFCSVSCSIKYQRPPIQITCEQCQGLFVKALRRINKTKHNFCCQSCAAKYNNAHKTKGTRTSKLEIWLSKQLPGLYPALEFRFNHKDAINGELDIYIPSLHLAFELNGIFHYEPIYGAEKLAKMQTNDARKAQACVEHGIELCLIDVSTQKYFKEQSSMKFLQIIQNIINIKLSESSPVTSDCLTSTT